jgi:cytochrome c-type biogenesis protein CcmE
VENTLFIGSGITVSEVTWEKPISAAPQEDKAELLKRLQVGRRAERLKFLIGGLLILAAIGYLLISGTLLGQRFFITVEEALADPSFAGQNLRLTGAVIGPTIQEETLPNGRTRITFSIAHIPTQNDDLAQALFDAANNPNATQLQVVVENQPRPELLRHEAQAILSGRMDENGVFHASELQFKCPSRFEEAAPVIES